MTKKKLSHDGVFILDEMKDFIDDEKAVSWLESRLNVMRKHSVDFVFHCTAMQEEYIHPNLVGLANACNVYRTRKGKGKMTLTGFTSTMSTGESPRLLDNDVANAVGKEIVRKPVEMYNTYETSESAFYNGAENDTYFGLKWYQERAWKLRFALLAIAVVAVVIVGYIIHSLVGAVDSLDVKQSEVGYADNKEKPKVERAVARSVDASDLPTCFHWKVCTQSTCETDIGHSRLSMKLIVACVLLLAFATTNAREITSFSSRGRLLRTGGEVSEGTGRRLTSSVTT